MAVGGSPGALPTSPLVGDYDRDNDVDLTDRLMWVAQFGATLFAGLGADGNLDGHVDAADYTLWRDAYVPPAAAAPTIAIALVAVSGEVLAKPAAARPIASSPPRRTELLDAARDFAFAELGREEPASLTTSRKSAARKIGPARSPVEPLFPAFVVKP